MCGGVWVGVGGRMSYHTAEVGDGGILVGVGVEQHLCICVDGYVRMHVLFALAQELGNSLDLRLRLGVRATVCVVTGVGGGAFLWVVGQQGEIKILVELLVVFFIFRLPQHSSVSLNYTDILFCCEVCYFLIAQSSLLVVRWQL